MSVSDTARVCYSTTNTCWISRVQATGACCRWKRMSWKPVLGLPEAVRSPRGRAGTGAWLTGSFETTRDGLEERDMPIEQVAPECARLVDLNQAVEWLG